MNGERSIWEFVLPWVGGLIASDLPNFGVYGFVGLVVIVAGVVIATSKISERFDRRNS
jgi:hypothetical protein